MGALFRCTSFLCLLLLSHHRTFATDKAASCTGAQIQWIRHYASLAAPGQDEPRLIAADHLGNIYVAGTSERISGPSGGTPKGIFIKYDRSSHEVWQKELATSQHDAMAVDSESNIYLHEQGGYYGGAQLSKYFADGTRSWSIPCDCDFLIDDGNCFAATRITESLGWFGPYSTNTVITKYSPEATIVWADTVLCDTTTQNYNRGKVHLGRDSDQNIVVAAGVSVVKLDSTGHTVWQLNDSVSHTHEMVLDGFNNIYMLSTNRTSGDVPLDSSYFLIKLSPGGNREWMCTFPPVLLKDSPEFRLQCDDAGCIFVVAYLDTALTIDKIRPTGEHMWSTTVKAGSYPQPWDCTVAPGGKLYVAVNTGNACAVTCLDSSGALAWSKTYLSSKLTGGIATDADGNLTVACAQKGNWKIVHADKHGAPLWEAIYDYKGNTQNYAYDLAPDHEGNVFVTGRSQSSAGRWEFATVKYAPDGTPGWAVRNSGDAHEGNYYRNLFLFVKPDGCPVISGADLVSLNDYGALTIQYDANGTKSWESRYQVQHEFRVEGLVGDKEGNVYITGTEYYWKVKYINPDVTWTTIKYSPAGTVLWTIQTRDTTEGAEVLYQAEDIGIDSAGNIVTIAMEHKRDDGYYSGIALQKCTQDGKVTWKTRLDDPQCELQDMEMSRHTDIYVSCLVRHPSGLQYETLMFDSAGALKWRSSIGGECAIPRTMAIDSEGGAYITGGSTTKYSRDGKLLWHLSDREGDAITCDAENSVYIVRDNKVTKRLSSGWTAWELLVPNTVEAGSFTGKKIKVDKDGNVIVTGNSTASSAEMSGIVCTTVRLSQSLTSVHEGERDAQDEFALEQNYPNPFNPVTVIKYSLGGAGGQESGIHPVRLVVYDLLGREVAVLVDDRKGPGSYTVQFDAGNLAGGVYLYRLTTGPYVMTRKCLVIK